MLNVSRSVFLVYVRDLFFDHLNMMSRLPQVALSTVRDLSYSS